MPDARVVTPEEIKRWTREFLQTDFWNLVLKPKLGEEREIISDKKRRAAVAGAINLPYGWEFYLMALDDFEKTWLVDWQGSDTKDNVSELDPPSYSGPRYPLSAGEE